MDSSDLGGRIRHREEQREGDDSHARPPGQVASTYLRLAPCVALLHVSHHPDAFPLQVVSFAPR